jgi:hypothetical protein
VRCVFALLSGEEFFRLDVGEEDEKGNATRIGFKASFEVGGLLILRCLLKEFLIG